MPKGAERLRITPSPYHDYMLIDALADALVDVWQRLQLPLNECALAAYGHKSFEVKIGAGSKLQLAHIARRSFMARIAQIVSTARYLPQHAVTNPELTARFAALGKPTVIAGLPRARASPNASTSQTTG